LTTALERLEKQINGTQKQIDECEKQFDTCQDPIQRTALEKKIEHLRKTEEQLRNKEVQLRNQLTELSKKENLLLQQQQQASVAASSTTQAILGLQSIRQAIEDVVAPIQQNQQNLVQRLMDDNKQIKEQLAQLWHPQGMTSPSRAELGQETWKRCSDKKEGLTAAMISDAIAHLTEREHPLVDSDDAELLTRPILPKTVLDQVLSALPSDYKERELIAPLTPYLAAVVDAVHPGGYMLANSEDLPWIQTLNGERNNFQKPDLFLCHRAAFSRGTAPGGKSVASERANTFRLGTDSATTFQFGRCVWRLRDALECIFEGKRRALSLHEAIGECLAKVQNLLANAEGRASHKCVLFDSEDVFLLHFSSTGLLSSRRFSWTAAGSFVVLLDFFHPDAESNWLRVLRDACRYFSVILPESDSFLGQGGTGRVFKVLSFSQQATASSQPTASSAAASTSTDKVPLMNDAEVDVLALKIVDGSQHHGDHLTTLHFEIDGLRKLLQRFHDSTALLQLLPTQVHGPYVVDQASHCGGAALFGPVGITVAHELQRGLKSCSLELWTEVSDALMQLHRHGVVHGDPRLPNLIRIPRNTPRLGATATRTSTSNESMEVGESQLKWIDFRQTSLFDHRHDISVCIRSFFPYHASKTETAFVASWCDRYASLLDQLRKTEEESCSSTDHASPSHPLLCVAQHDHPEQQLVHWVQEAWKALCIPTSDSAQQMAGTAL